MANEKTCFIIMPITTPEGYVQTYRDGLDHFTHVLDCLLAPAAVKAGYAVVRPTAKGADLIHAEIIRNLETADLVLCDMSCLNPNVLFEFGIRTALNRPVCVVKDEHTKRVPFDTGILNHHEYISALEPWNLERQVDVLAAHVAESATRSGGTNALWKYFGFRVEARPAEAPTGDAAKMDYLMMRLESIQRALEEDRRGPVTTGHSEEGATWRTDDELAKYIAAELRGRGLVGFSFSMARDGDRHVTVLIDKLPEPSDIATIQNRMKRRYGVELTFTAAGAADKPQ